MGAPRLAENLSVPCIRLQLRWLTFVATKRLLFNVNLNQPLWARKVLMGSPWEYTTFSVADLLSRARSRH